MLPIKIDMPTILLFLFFGNLIIAGMLAVYSSNTIVYSTNRQYLLGKILQSVAWILLALRGYIPDLISAYIGNSLLIAGLALEALALVSVETGSKKFVKYYAVLMLAFLFVFWGFARRPNQYVYVSSFFASVIFISVPLLLSRSSKRSILRYLLGGIFTLSGIILLVRGINAILNADYRLMSNEFSQNLTFFSTYFLMIISGSGFLLLQRERTDDLLKVANQELEQMAHFDSLTNLANRRKFKEHLTYGISESRRRAEPLTLIMADIDFFKSYNDLYGHIAGDNCLIEVAQSLTQHCKRSTDLIARFGGEEFSIVLLNTNVTEACRIAELIRKEVLDLAIAHGGSSISDSVTLSLGVFSATPTSDEHDYDWFILEADRRLYSAKHAGRNQSVCA
jgi:diguanylate cyclase (GGDEF)-like protein